MKKSFLFLMILFLFAPFFSITASPQSFTNSSLPSAIHGDGFLRLYNYHLNEFLEIQFRDPNVLKPEALEKINHLLRTRDDLSVLPINSILLDLLDHLQDHFGVDTVEIISGYRSKKFNESLLKSGHAVSPVSMHTQGKAMDIHLDEIREETLQAYVRSLKLGGVGFYEGLDFVHVDTGPVRFWQELSGKRKLVGVLNPKASAQLTSDRNDYFLNQNPVFEWSFQADSGLDQITELHLERFFRGTWRSVEAYIPKQSQFSLSSKNIHKDSFLHLPDHAGKYRITFKLSGMGDWLSSNEFYFKRK